MRHPLIRRSLLLALPLTAALAACDTGRVDTKKVKEEMQDRKLFHVTDLELMTGAETVGSRTIRRLDSLRACRTEAMGSACKTQFDSLSQKLRAEDIRVDRLFFADWKVGKDSPKVTEVLEAVKYTHDAGQPVPHNLQRDEQGGFHYVAPIHADSGGSKREVGIYSLRYSSKPAVKEASKGKKGM